MLILTNFDQFYGKVNFGHIGFSMEKVKTFDFSLSFVACDLKDTGNILSLRSCVSIQGQCHFLTMAKGHLHNY